MERKNRDWKSGDNLNNRIERFEEQNWKIWRKRKKQENAERIWFHFQKHSNILTKSQITPKQVIFFWQRLCRDTCSVAIYKIIYLKSLILVQFQKLCTLLKPSFLHSCCQYKYLDNTLRTLRLKSLYLRECSATWRTKTLWAESIRYFTHLFKCSVI